MLGDAIRHPAAMRDSKDQGPRHRAASPPHVVVTKCGCSLAHTSPSTSTIKDLHSPLHVVDADALQPGLHTLALQCHRCVLRPSTLSVHVTATGDLNDDGTAQLVDDGNTTMLVMSLTAQSRSPTLWRALLPAVCITSTMVAVLAGR